MARITNLVKNGRAKYTSGTVEVRRNRAIYPTASDSSWYTVYPAGDGVATAFGTTDAGRPYIAATWSTVSVGGNIRLVTYPASSPTHISVTPGETIPISVVAAVSNPAVNQNVRIGIDWYNESTWISASASPWTPVTDNINSDTNRLSWTTPAAPSDASILRAFVQIESSNIKAGTVFRARDLLVGDTGLYFDGGSSSPDPDLTPSWTGTANASASVLTGKRTASWEGSGKYLSSMPDGLRVMGGPGNIYQKIETPGAFFAIAFDMRITGSVSTAPIRLEKVNPPYTALTLLRYTDGIADGKFHSYVRSGAVPTSDKMHHLILYTNTSASEYTVRNIIAATAPTEAEALSAVQTYFDGDSEPFRYGPIAQLVVPKWSGTPGQSSSYFDYEEPWTVGMQWDKAIDRRFELGVDRGVLYNRSMVGVPWNGLINVTEKLTNTEITRYYQDGSKYYTDLSTPEFSATVEAFTYPDILDTFTGKTEIVNGLYADENAFQFFHFSYRTLIGDAVYGSDKFYKIHLVYNAYAVPTAKAYGTINESPSASTFSWDVTTDSIAILPGTNSLQTSHLIIDSRKVPASKLKNLETILYGTSTISPRLPLPAEVRTILA